MLKQGSDQVVEQLMGEIANAVRILVTGENCSGLAIRIVAMRLMHLGCRVYLVGENITPSIIRAGDLLIACSESGSAVNANAIAQKARGAGARIVSVTTQAESVLGKVSDVVIKIAAVNQDCSNKQSQQFAVSLFEQSTLLLFDTLFYVMTQNLNKNAQMLWALHTSLEAHTNEEEICNLT